MFGHLCTGSQLGGGGGASGAAASSGTTQVTANFTENEYFK